jgi:hypothetical protein
VIEVSDRWVALGDSAPAFNVYFDGKVEEFETGNTLGFWSNPKRHPQPFVCVERDPRESARK